MKTAYKLSRSVARGKTQHNGIACFVCHSAPPASTITRNNWYKPVEKGGERERESVSVCQVIGIGSDPTSSA